MIVYLLIINSLQKKPQTSTILEYGEKKYPATNQSASADFPTVFPTNN